MAKLIASRRNLLVLGAGLLAPAVVTRSSLAEEKEGVGERLQELATGEGKEDVTPPEDLMREHGVLDRVMLVYEAAMRKVAAKEDFDTSILSNCAQIVRDFIEDYHEKLEEDYVFPRFKQAGRMVDLVDTLLEQHKAGRRVTDAILEYAPSVRNDEDALRQTTDAIRAFIAMYRPHAAREDTDLFPKLRTLVSSNEYDSMAEEFEDKEHRLFGEDGFEKMADRVAKLEEATGTHDLARFTPA